MSVEGRQCSGAISLLGVVRSVNWQRTIHKPRSKSAQREDPCARVSLVSRCPAPRRCETAATHIGNSYRQVYFASRHAVHALV
jgi:hypothetical protein